MRLPLQLSAFVWLFAAAVACAADLNKVEDSVGSSINTVADAEVRRLLILELEKHYPSVTQWELLPVVGGTQWTEYFRAAPNAIEVLHAGARSAVRLTWKQLNTANKTHTLWYEVKGVSQVWVATHEAIAGAALSAMDVSEVERDVMALGCEPIVSAESLQNMRAKRLMRQDQPVCLEDIEPRPAVARGELVAVRYESDRISITSRGIARRDAAIGQKLQVTNPVTRDSFSAVVSAAHEVIVND